MSRTVTFVLVGKRKGATINIGPSNRYRFVNGEMKVREQDASLMAVALSNYAAHPKGDAEQFHLAACRKLGIDPETLEPLSEEIDPAEVEEPLEGAELEVAEPVIVEPLKGAELEEAILSILERANPNEGICWTASGLVSVNWVNSQLPGSVGATRSMLDEYDVVRYPED